MRKKDNFSQSIAKFFYEGRLALFVLTIIIMLFMVTIAPSLKINSDMSKYLNESSNMKQGMDILKTEFEEDEVKSSLRLMFTGLENVSEVSSRLKEFSFIKEIEHENNADFVSGDKKLFIVKCNIPYEAEEFRAFEKKLPSIFSGLDFKFQSDEIQRSEVKTSILIFAFLAVVIILTLMCASWIEPFIIMLCGGVAVAINIGSNWLLPYVSDISHSIGPILQLVLSIDYSVMLLNRFRQEKRLGSEKPLQSAIQRAFAPIMASAVTTIAGLIALVFMGFRIGGEIGLVLAKGVFLSLVCVFFVLPQLIKWLEGPIEMTAKKSVVLKTGGLVKFSYIMRYAMPILFIALICLGYFFKDNTKIIFTEGIRDEIAESFDKKNQCVLIYDNADEGKIPKLLEEIEGDEGVKSLVAYSNTLNKPLSVDELLKNAESFSKGLSREALSIIYSRHEKKELPSIKASELFGFLLDEMPKINEKYKLFAGNELKNIEKLKPFIDKEKLNSESELSALFGILGLSDDESVSVGLAYALKSGLEPSRSLSIREIEAVISLFEKMKLSYSGENNTSNSSASNAGSSSDSLSAVLKKLTSGAFVQRLPAGELFAENKIEGEAAQLLSAAVLCQSPEYQPKKLPFLRAMQLICRLDSSNEELKGLDSALKLFASDTQLSAQQLAGIAGIDEEMLGGLFAKSFGDTEKKLSLRELLKLLKAEELQGMLNDGQKAQILKLAGLAELAGANAELSYAELAKMLNIDENSIKMAYATADLEAAAQLKLSQLELAEALLALNERQAFKLSEDRIENLKRLKMLVKANEENTAFSYQEFAKDIGAEKNDIKKLFILAEPSENLLKQKTSLLTLAGFIYELRPSDNIKSALRIAELTNDEAMLSAVEAKTELDKLLISEDKKAAELDGEKVRLLYEYYFARSYDSKNGHKIPIIELIPFINEQIELDLSLRSMLSDDETARLKQAENDILNTKKKLVSDKYSRLVIESSYKEESEETSQFMAKINSLKDKLPSKAYLVGSSQLVYELENNFQKEFRLVSIICIASIFMVVLLSFRSLIIPALLVLLVQLGVYITVCIIGIQGYNIYYLALLIVQSILMGATIDYAIVLSSYYKELRQKMPVREAMENALSQTLHTIACSGLILIIVAAILGIFVKTLTISQICSTIALGAFATVLLIIFVLPSLIMFLDRLIMRGKNGFTPSEKAKAALEPENSETNEK